MHEGIIRKGCQERAKGDIHLAACNIKTGFLRISYSDGGLIHIKACFLPESRVFVEEYCLHINPFGDLCTHRQFQGSQTKIRLVLVFTTPHINVLPHAAEFNKPSDRDMLSPARAFVLDFLFHVSHYGLLFFRSQGQSAGRKHK